MSDLDVIEARDRLARVKEGVERLYVDVVALYQGRAWIALGYASWNDLCEAEFAGTRFRLPAAERAEVIGQMREAGMSTRAIASAVGVTHTTVRREVSTGTFVPVDTVHSLDGRVMPARATRVSLQPPPDPLGLLSDGDRRAIGHALAMAPLTEVVNQLQEIALEAERQQLPRILDGDGTALPLAPHHRQQLQACADRLQAKAHQINDYLRSNQ